jgi:hypothetical protein
MRTLAAFLLLATLVGVLVLLWRRGARKRSVRRVTRHIYRCTDELLGARRFEADRAVTRHHYVRYIPKLGPLLARFLYPLPKLGGTVVLPPYRRMRRYVQVEFGIWRDGKLLPVPPGLAVHIWHAHAVTLRWSSETAANSDGFIERLERGRVTMSGGQAGLAQALGLQWFDGLFSHKRDDKHSRVTFTRTYAHTVPERGRWEEVLDGGG